MAELTPYSYRSGNSLLYRLPALGKLGILLLLSVLSFTASPVILSLCAILVFSGALNAQTAVRELFAGSRALLISSLFIVIIKTLSFEAPYANGAGFREGLLFVWRIMTVYSAAALFFSCTSTVELRSAAEKMETVLTSLPRRILFQMGNPKALRLKKLLEKNYGALALALMLAFIPRIFFVWETAQTAYTARYGKKGLRSLLYIVPLVTERMIEAAAESAIALQARGSGS